MTSVKSAVICAAGIGSRLGLGITKCLLKVGNKSLIDYQLDLLRDIPDLRIVVGFQADKVIEHIKKVRDDVTFISNYYYRTTSSSYSAYLGTRGISGPLLILAGDLLIEPYSFFNFLRECRYCKSSLIGITTAKSQHPVFVDLDERERVVGFKRKPRAKFEWPCIAFLSGIEIDRNKKYIFENIVNSFPVNTYRIICNEIDTKHDLEVAIRDYESRVSGFVSTLYRSV